MLPIAILAGGLATRMRPLTEAVPKSLLLVAGEPFVLHQLRLLKANGFEHVVLCLGYLGEAVEAAVRCHPELGLDVAFAYDGPALLGTGGALKAALPLLDDEFFVLYGDSYLPIDYSAVERAFESQKKAGLMTVYRNDGMWDTSNVEFDGTNIRAYDKVNRTPQMRFIDYGVGILEKSAFEAVPSDRPTELSVIYQALLREGQLGALEIQQRFYEIGSPSGLDQLSNYLAVRSTTR